MSEWEEGFKVGMDFGKLSDAIDGEGSISLVKWIRRGTVEYCLRAYITNTDYEYLDKLRGICLNEGSIRIHAKKGTKGSSGVTAKRDSYRYYIPIVIFKQFLPYLDLVVKQRHKWVAEKYFMLTDVGVGHSTTRHTDYEFSELEKLYLEMKELNRR